LMECTQGTEPSTTERRHQAEGRYIQLVIPVATATVGPIAVIVVACCPTASLRSTTAHLRSAKSEATHRWWRDGEFAINVQQDVTVG